MAGPDRFNILIVDPDSGTRGNLKQAALVLSIFNKVFPVSNIREAFEYTEGLYQVDLVVLSYRFSLEEARKFMQRCRETKRGNDWAFIYLLRADQQSNDTIAQAMLGGIDGFIFEPFSPDNLREMAEVAKKVRANADSKRKRAALEVIVREMISHLDAVAFLRSKKRDAKRAVGRLKEASETLTKYRAESEMVDVMIDLFGQVPAPVVTNYSGPSQRLRERLEAKAFRELEERYGSKN